MLSYTHELFGHNKPELTGHFFQRYAERVFNVPEKTSESWARVNHNRIRIVKDFYSRLLKCKLLKLSEIENRDYYERKYGKDTVFLQNNNYVFVVRDYKAVVTVYRKQKGW